MTQVEKAVPTSVAEWLKDSGIEAWLKDYQTRPDHHHSAAWRVEALLRELKRLLEGEQLMTVAGVRLWLAGYKRIPGHDPVLAEELASIVEKRIDRTDKEIIVEQSVFESIEEERRFQDEKHGIRWDLGMTRWISIIGEEFGEVCRAEQNKDVVNFHDELIDIAAAAARAAQAMRMMYPEKFEE